MALGNTSHDISHYKSLGPNVYLRQQTLSLFPKFLGSNLILDWQFLEEKAFQFLNSPSKPD